MTYKKALEPSSPSKSKNSLTCAKKKLIPRIASSGKDTFTDIGCMNYR